MSGMEPPEFPWDDEFRDHYRRASDAYRILISQSDGVRVGPNATQVNHFQYRIAEYDDRGRKREQRRRIVRTAVWLLAMSAVSPLFALISLLAAASFRSWPLLYIAGGIAAFWVISAVLRHLRRTREARRQAGLESSIARFSVRGLTGLAALLAGGDGPALRTEWMAHLAGESGHDPLNWPKVKQAVGFVITGVRYRCSNMADALWKPADAVLRSRTRSNLLFLVPTGVAAYLIFRHDGTVELLKSFESIGTIGGLLYSVIRVGRWWRNVKPPEPKAHRAKE